MKKAKRLVSLLLAFVMLLSLTVVVGAADVATQEGKLTGGQITITNPAAGERYDLYQVMYLDSFEAPAEGGPTDSNGNPIGGKYSYVLTSAWQEFLDYPVPNTDNKTVKDVYLSVDPNNGMVTWNQSAGTTDLIYQAFAQLALEYANANDSVKPVVSKVASADAENLVFGDLNLGYYLIDTTLGTLCTLDTTNKMINVEEKNTVPTNEKQVKEDFQPTNWQQTTTVTKDGTTTTVYGNNDDDIGSVVQFRSFITVGKGTDKLFFHDVMSSGLTLLPETVTVSAKKESDGSYTPFLATETTGSETVVNYIVTSGDSITTNVCKGHAEKCDLHIEFKDGVLDRIKYGTANTYQIVIEYKAVINENAVVGAAGNPNTSFLEYGNNGSYTPDSTTLTKTWGFDVLKYELDGSTQKGLKGAKFSLHRQATTGISADPVEDTTDNLGETIKLVLKSAASGTVGDADYKPAVYRVAKIKVKADGTPDKDVNDNVQYDETAELLDNIVTDESGMFRIEGLDSSTYLLNEDDAPAGYKKLLTPVQVVIDYNVTNGGDCTIKQGTNTVDMVRVQNGTGSELPSTGGIGTTIFYVAGSILLIGAAVLLIVKKRMSDEK